MKKYAIAALAAIMALSSTACSGNTNSTSSTSSTSSTGSTGSSETSGSEISTAEAPATADASSSGTAGSTAESGVDLQAVYDKIMDAQENVDNIVMFPETSEDYFNGFYSGLLELDLRQTLLYMPPVTGNACEILLVEAADSENADKAEAIMKARVKIGADDTTYPEVAEVWQTHAMVERSGNLLCMIALPMSCTVPDDVFAL